MPTYREDKPQRLYPNLYGGISFFYQESNPAQAEILIGPRMQAIVAEYTFKVMESYLNRIAPRSDSGAMLGSTYASVQIGGYKNDRWVGEITVGVEYAMADEFGRDTPQGGQNSSTYEGSGDLRAALYGVLPTAI